MLTRCTRQGVRVAQQAARAPWAAAVPIAAAAAACIPARRVNAAVWRMANPHAAFSVSIKSEQGPVPAAAAKPAAPSAYSTREEGQRGTPSWRLFVQRDSRDISPWHDIPLLAPGSDRTQLLFSYVNEIPRGTRPKMEVSTTAALNPLAQDTKKGKLREFTYGDIPFNYGMLPQTWENVTSVHHLTNRGGDNDPLDVVELSLDPIPCGHVRAVKILGALALLDENETDWKLLAIDAAHPLAARVNNEADVEFHFPGRINAVREWFRMYKTTDGKGINEFALDGAVLPVQQALTVVWETHADWARLVRNEIAKHESTAKLHWPKEIPEAARHTQHEESKQ